MEGILVFFLSYLILLILWFVLVLLFFSLSLVFKKNLVAIPEVLTYLVSFGIQIYLIGYALYILWLIISNHEWLLLILALIFGGFVIGFWQTIYDFLLFPFNALSNYFLNKVGETDFSEDIVAGEVLDEDNKVIDISEGDTALKRRFAKYFLSVYAMNLIPLIIFPVEREGLYLFDFVTKPFFQIISLTLIFGVPYGVYRKIRYKSFLTKDKRYFLIQVWKISLCIYLPLLVILYLFALVTNTL